MASFFLTSALAFTLLIQTGCDSNRSDSLVIATTWSEAEQARFEANLRSKSPKSPRIEWITIEPGESLTNVIHRRGGVDLILGAPSWSFERLRVSGQLASFEPSDSIPWRMIQRPTRKLGSFRQIKDPRVDPASFAFLRSTLQDEGWPKGYESLVRQKFADRNESRSAVENSPEAVAIVRNGRHSSVAQELVALLTKQGVVSLPDPEARVEAVADSLLADLLGAALVDASRELRDAGSALTRFNHPAVAEASIGERPPWPPASVLKLREGPNGEALVETLLEQVSPDRESRDWLRESWSRPKRPIDGTLLREIALAADGRLAAEPRFRAWLRGEWTAWTRQLYRRVARLAGGYVPS